MSEIQKQSEGNSEKEEAVQEEIMPCPQWLKGLIYVSDKVLYLGLNIFVFFVNRGLFALKALASFNLFLCILVFLNDGFTII